MSEIISFPETQLSDLKIAQDVSVDSRTGAASIQVGIPATSGRSGVQPSLSLTYGSGGGNSPFGRGWGLSGIPAIQISLKDGAPRYDGHDKFTYQGQVLVPLLENTGAHLQQQQTENEQFIIQYFRPKLEADFSRIEQWIDKSSRQVHWRVRNRSNHVFIFGRSDTGLSRISDPECPDNVFQWLLEAFYDNRGNAIEYDYITENTHNVNNSDSYERQRVLSDAALSQRYIKRIRYGNRVPVSSEQPEATDQKWLFELVFDYGDHETTGQPVYTPSTTGWPTRIDPFSSYIPGFEIRTYRLCHRILMFHHMEELGTEPTITGALELNYQPHESGTLLESIAYTGYRRDTRSGDFTQKSLPPLKYIYSNPSLEQSFQPVPSESTENMPVGLGGLNYRWVDLKGDGLPGVLFENQQSWYYKSNLGNGLLGKQELVANKPAAATGTYGLSDFDNDGNPGLVLLQGREAGYYEFDRDDGEWQPYQAFSYSPNVRPLDTYTQLLDLTGDGQADIVTVEQNRIVYYPSKGKKGFDKPVDITKPYSNGRTHTSTIGANPNLDYFFVDMTGDGRPDQVRVMNGRVEYWPNLGRGRFGNGIVMENSPWLEGGFELDASRMRLVDLDGSGTSDLVYIGRGEIRYWINASGNRFIDGGRIHGLPFIDNLASAQIIDFLGNGTACLVWSKGASSNQTESIQYLQLTGGVKPGLMKNIQNSMGQEIQLEYSTSAEHYLRDLNTPHEWISKLPSHVTVVNRLVTLDHIGNTRFVQQFEYHDGFYDSHERTFRGFGLVDQYDSDIYQGTSTLSESEFTAPSCIRTWYHNGAPGWEFKRGRRFYQEDSLATPLPSFVFENLNDIGHDEYNDAIRAMAGRVVRTEVFAVDNTGQRHLHPYQVTQQGYSIRHIQARLNKHEPVYAVFGRETIESNYEQAADDPRIGHNLICDIDEYGNPLSSVTIAYPRRSPDAFFEQQQTHIVTQLTEVININTNDRCELGIPVQQRSFELSGATAPAAMELYSYREVKEFLAAALLQQIPFSEIFTGLPQAKLIQWAQSYYWNNDHSDVLPLGATGEITLPHHAETACFNDDFVASAMGGHYDPTLLSSGAYYTYRDDYWWQSSAVTHFHERSVFYLPYREITPTGEWSEYQYDAHKLLLTAVNDSLGNSVTSDIDYHVIVPYRITDINNNISEVYYDALGMIIVSTAQGRLRSDTGTDDLYGHELLENYTPQTDETFDQILATPERYIQGMASYLYYELDNWNKPPAEQGPLRSISLIRENWVYDGNGGAPASPAIAIAVNYRDGFGRDLQSKQRVDSGAALQIRAMGELETIAATERWLTSGHVVLNNKQQPIRQFEPFYSAEAGYQDDGLLETFGHSVLIQYDALGRETRQNFPDGTRSFVESSPWSNTQYDPNDSVAGSDYEARINAIPDSSHPEKQALAKALRHNNTPITNHLDIQGRAFLVEEQNENGDYRRIRTELDIQGNPLSITDPRGLNAFRYRYDMRGLLWHEYSMDAGEKWSFVNGLDQITHSWDQNNNHLITSYDNFGRVTSLSTHGNGDNHVIERYIYGDNTAESRARNLNGQLAELFDQSGYQEIHKYDLTGTVLKRSRRLLADYKFTPDWPESPLLSDYVWLPDNYETSVKLDAIGRSLEEQLPDGSTRHYTYHRDGNLKRIGITTADGEWHDAPILQDATYNARGQRISTLLGNAVASQYSYSPTSYRMQRLHSYHQASTGTRRLFQEIHYTYDPVGNLVQNIDLAQQAHSEVIRNLGERGSALNKYTYDAFYQLTQAQGRVHQTLLQNDYSPSASDTVKGTRRIDINDGSRVERYTRNYQYDLAGNLLNVNHLGDSRSWNRQNWTSVTSNRSLPLKDLNGIEITAPESRFDANGNCLHLPHLRSFVWNYKNQLAEAILIDRSAEGKVNDAEYYVYAGDGMRIRKVHEQLVGTDGLRVTEKIYLDGCEIKRVTNRGTLELERKSIHVSDTAGRIAIIHHWSVDTLASETDDLSQKKIHYQLGDHLASSSLELDQATNLISYEEYFPYGETAFIAGNEREIKLKDYRYTGKERDDVTGLYYFGYRYYAAWIGNWLSPDPIGPEDGLNLYQYVQNNPVNLVDPNGLQSSIRVPIERIPALPDGYEDREGGVLFVKNGEDGNWQPVLTGNELSFYLGNHTSPIIGLHATDSEIANLVERNLIARDELGYFVFYTPETDILLEDADESTDGSSESNPEPSESEDSEADRSQSGTETGGNQGQNEHPGGEHGENEDGDRGSRSSAHGNGEGETRGRGRPGGAGNEGGHGNGQQRRIPEGARTTTDPSQVQADPRARIDGSSRGSLTGTVPPEEVHSELGMAGGIDGGTEYGTPGGTLSGGQPPEELAWWQITLIVTAVIAVSIITAGAATALLTSIATVGIAASGGMAAISLGVATETMIAIGATAGFAAGIAGDALAQAMSIGIGAQTEFNGGQLLFAGTVGLVTGGIGSYFSGVRAAASTSNSFLRAAGTRFTAGALEGGSEELARQIIFDDEIDLTRVGIVGAMGGGINVGVGVGVDVWKARQASLRSVPTSAPDNLSGELDISPQLSPEMEVLKNIAENYRSLTGPDGRNIAVIEYIVEGEARYGLATSRGGGSDYHAEALLDDEIINYFDIEPEAVTRIYSELEFCNDCMNMINAAYPDSIEKGFSYYYNGPLRENATFGIQAWRNMTSRAWRSASRQVMNKPESLGNIAKRIRR